MCLTVELFGKNALLIVAENGELTTYGYPSLLICSNYEGIFLLFWVKHLINCVLGIMLLYMENDTNNIQLPYRICLYVKIKAEKGSQYMSNQTR